MKNNNLLKVKNFISKNFFILTITFFMILVFSSMVKINVFRYENFDMGKFDLGNMTQMAWYSLRGKFMYLTDYFGSNVPRWSMSHVDPILVLFLPFFAIIPHPLTLVFAQNILVILGSLILYKLAVLKTQNKFLGLFLALAYLSYPALGFLQAWTGYHGVTPAIFFFLLFFYIYEKFIYEKKSELSVKQILILLLIAGICMSGKEQIPLYFTMVSFYIFFTSLQKRLAIILFFVSLIWFIICFFVIIPHFAQDRINSFENFVDELQLDTSEVPNIYSSNYFLSRYSEFGSSYSEIISNMILNPIKTAAIFTSGDKLNNLYLTFGPVLYLSFLHPFVVSISFPDLLINYSTTQGGIGTSEIYNHRISMIIPVIFLSILYGISFFQNLLQLILRKDIYKKFLSISLSVLGLIIFLNSVYFSTYIGEKNPIFSWIIEAVNKRVFAKTTELDKISNLEIGKVYRISPLENNDRECVSKIIEKIPPLVSVSGPDFMGAHLAQRETYAIFPANINNSDYIIVDVFSKKLLRILELDYSLNKDFLSIVLNNPNYDINMVCANFLVFKKNGEKFESTQKNLLPIQKILNVKEDFSYEIFNGLHLVKSDFPKELKLDTYLDLTYTYKRNESKNLNGFNLFTTMIHKETGETFQFVNYPTFVYTDITSLSSRYFLEEKFKVRLPSFLEVGPYHLFVGMDNGINTRSLYLGEVSVR
jgi:uncharacterized membrane protein